jgi:hypothetical protein
MGSISTLSAGEAALCSEHSLTPRTLGRAWEYWTFRLAKAEAATAGARVRRPAPKASAKPRRGSIASRKKSITPSKRAAGVGRKTKRVKRR